MKKILLFTLLFTSIISNLKAQIYTPSGIIQGSSSANVGIGTSTPESGYKIDVNGSATIGNNGSTRVYLGTLDSNTSYLQSRNTTINKNLSIFADNVGIGTTTPMQKFVVSNGAAEGLEVYLGQPTGTVGLQVYNRSTSQYNKMAFAASQYTFDYGNVGIGTTSPDSKLTVKGKIHAEEVKVDLTVPADYVFEKYYLGKSSMKPDYNLLTLSEVEKFTAANHHLPNVPSAKEIKENGLLLGEMSNILLQKVEELTLYSIDQQKTIEKLEKENQSFKKLEERLIRLEKELETKK